MLRLLGFYRTSVTGIDTLDMIVLCLYYIRLLILRRFFGCNHLTQFLFSTILSFTDKKNKSKNQTQ